MALWILASALFAVWFAATFLFGKSGFIHILLLNAIAVAVIQFIHERRAARQ